MNRPRVGLAARIEVEEIALERARGWVNFHPEDYCHLCGNRNLSWWVESALWNAVFRAPDSGDLERQTNGIVCPPCFADLYARRFGSITWELRLDIGMHP